MRNSNILYLSIAGIMVAVNASAQLQIASTDYVDRIVAGVTATAGSIITGYLGTTSGSMLLVGSTSGGPFASRSLSNMGSEIVSAIGSHAAGLSWVQGSKLVVSASGSGLNVFAGTGSTGYQGFPASYLGSYVYGSMIYGYETVQLSSLSGTKYFPVMHGGKIYGIDANDFYTLLNVQQ